MPCDRVGFRILCLQMLEDFMIQRMNENDKIVSRYMDDKVFEDAAFALLSRVIYDTIPAMDTVVFDREE